MEINKIDISIYAAADHAELLRLLNGLHSAYFFQNAAPEIRELSQEKDLQKSYESYLDLIAKKNEDSWLILLAKQGINNVVGFIIGSIETDNSLVLSKIGKFEDWFVEQPFRRRGIGMKLYNELEKWFRENGCGQVRSDTWQGNELSIKAHQQAGFFISGISFGKKL